MAYMNQERKSIIAAAVKPVLAKYGMKGSLSVNNHSSIVLTLTSGAIDFEGKGVNIYWIDEHFSGVARDFLNEIVTAMKSASWFDDSDIQTDYFHTAYYIHVNVGRWNKPYQYAGGSQKVAA
jgi:hypothetical protein